MSYGLPTGTNIAYGALALSRSTIEGAAGGATNTIRPLTPVSGMSRRRASVDATPKERWLPVVGWEGLYEVSDQGRVRSLDRQMTVKAREGLYEVSDQGRVRSLDRQMTVKASNRSRSFSQSRKGRVLTPLCSDGYSYPRVQLCRDGVIERHRVHRLVACAFLGPCPIGMHVCHWDDNPLNNRLSNLRYGTGSDNAYDKVRNGRHNEASKTHCKRGHEFTFANTYIYQPTGARRCRECKRIRGRKSWIAKNA